MHDGVTMQRGLLAPDFPEDSANVALMQSFNQDEYAARCR
jgi:hypothetical protein